MEMQTKYKSYFSRIARVVFLILVIIVSKSLIDYSWNEQFYKTYNFKTIEKVITYQLNSELENQIEDLKQVKDKLENEVNDLSRDQVNLVNDISDEIEQLEAQFSNLFFLANKTKAVEKTILKVQQHIYSNRPYSTLDTCFNYTKCEFNSKINVYIHEKNILNLTKNIDNVYQIVDSIENSCLTIYFAKSKESASDFLKNIDQYKGNSDNLLIINLVDDYNIFDDSKSIQIKMLNKLKCSIYASFDNYVNNEIFKSRFSNLFFHFSVIHQTTKMTEYAENVKEKQQQNSLLLTNKRTYLLSYYQTKNRIIEEALKNIKPFNLINCTINQDDCKSDVYRFEVLSYSTFLLISNDNIKYSVLWSKTLTKRLIEALSVGTIPLILDLDSKLPLDDLINWDEVVLRLPFEQISDLKRILSQINEADVISRRIRASKIYNRYFKTPEIQFNTLITAIRERIRLPATAIGDYVDKDVEKYPQINELNVNMTKYTDKSIQINDDEYLGPVKDNGALQQKKEYQFNMTFNNYFSWNVLFYPFNIMPTTPFDQFLPIDLKYSSIDEPSDDPNYFFGGSFGGQYFSDKLRGNTDDNEQFTMVILTFNRERLLTSVLLEYFKMPYLNQIIIVWNSIQIKPTNEFYYIFRKELKLKLLTLVYGKENSLGNRFLPYEFIRTEAVIALDDDTQLRNDEIIYGFRIWRENRDRLVGFPSRFHSWNPINQTFRYKSDFTCEYSLILTGGAFYHRFYHYYYHHLLDKRIREKIDEYMNCEDVAFNFMISDLTRKPPLKVTTKTSFNCKLCASDEDIQESLSANKLHFERRSTCINYFNQVYGYNPLLYSQIRGDSILFAESFEGMQSCFKNV